jgi:hypothetical protein
MSVNTLPGIATAACALAQDLVQVLSRPDTWKTALKHDQAAYQRNADGSYKVS